jgi:hypothetical protein
MDWIIQCYGRWRHGFGWRWLLAAVAVATVYTIALLPATGIFGGLFVLLLGWAVPSLINILVSISIILLFPVNLRRPVVPILGLTLSSFMLAIGVEAPAILQRVLHPPIIRYSVARALRVPSGSVSPTFACSPGFPGECDVYVDRQSTRNAY